MKLDSRIKNVMEIFTNNEKFVKNLDPKKYWNKYGYCTDKFENYQNLDNTVVGQLINIKRFSDYPYVVKLCNGDTILSKFFLPDMYVEYNNSQTSTISPDDIEKDFIRTDNYISGLKKTLKDFEEKGETSEKLQDELEGLERMLKYINTYKEFFYNK